MKWRKTLLQCASLLLWGALQLPLARAQSGALQVLHNFTLGAQDSNTFSVTNSDGSFPLGLVLSGSTLYGVTERAGSGGNGAVFALNTNGAGFATLYNFTPLIPSVYPYVNTDGAQPQCLVVAGNKLYGTAEEGGMGGYGTVFALNTDGTGFTVLYGFTNGNDGSLPTAGLVLAGNTLYGTARLGGASGNGTVFALNINGTNFTTLYNFSDLGTNSDTFAPTNSDGANPQAGLFLAGNTLYGTAEYGGLSGNGTVFALNTDGTGFTTLYGFSDTEFGSDAFTNGDGANPEAGLIFSNGTLFGTTSQGGSGGTGTVFSVNNDGTGFATLHNFSATSNITNSDGSTPLAGLVLTSNTLYGATSDGGGAGAGTIFTLSTNGSDFVVLHTFTGGSDGAEPSAEMLIANSILYGTASEGGSGSGTVFNLPVGPVYPPTITVNPASQSVESGGSLTLQAAASGSILLKYQWFFDGAKIAGATNTALTLTSVATSKSGSYDVIVTNSYGAATSTVATVTVLVPPSITTQPVAQTEPLGGIATFSVKAAGSPLTYQWLFNNVPLSDGGNISGSATNKLTVAPVASDNVGSYSVVVSNSSVAVTSKPVTLALKTETTKPALTIKFPTSNSRTNAPVFSGTASDSVRVLSVEYWVTNVNQGMITTPLNGQAVLTNETGTVSNWTIPTAQLALLPGTNILVVQSSNYAGLVSPIEKTTFFYQVPAFLSLTTNGSGAITGAAAIKTDPAPPAKTELYVGEGYTLTAKAGKNCWLTNWMTNGVIAGTNSTLSFIMQPNLAVTANFVTNLFVGMAARYDGIFYLSSSAGVSEPTSGLIENLLLKTNGIYSGKMYLAGTTISLSGTFNNAGQATESLGSIAAAGGKATLLLNANFSGPPRVITGMVEGTGWTSSNLNLVAATTNTNNFPAYTVLLPQDANDPGSPPNYGYLLVTNTGSMVNMGGFLADGTQYSRSEPINEEDEFPVYANLYGNKGLLLGQMSLSAGVFGAVPAGSMTWIQPVQKTGLFTNGFTTGLGVEGSPWTNAPSALAAFTNELQLTFSNGGFASNIVCTVQLTSSNTLKLLNGPNFYSGSVNPKNGLMTLTFTNASKKRVTATGTLLQNLSVGGGFFLGTTNAGAILLQSVPPFPPIDTEDESGSGIGPGVASSPSIDAPSTPQ